MKHKKLIKIKGIQRFYRAIEAALKQAKEDGKELTPLLINEIVMNYYFVSRGKGKNKPFVKSFKPKIRNKYTITKENENDQKRSS